LGQNFWGVPFGPLGSSTGSASGWKVVGSMPANVVRITVDR